MYYMSNYILHIIYTLGATRSLGLWSLWPSHGGFGPHRSHGPIGHCGGPTPTVPAVPSIHAFINNEHCLHAWLQ